MACEVSAKAFLKLGQKLKEMPESQLKWLCAEASARNSWFIEPHVKAAVEGIIHMLEPNTFIEWINRYPQTVQQPKTVGVIMAGNIPLAGFHDFLCVLVSGHRIAAKLSSQDNFLLPQLAKMLFEIEPELAQRVEWAEQLKGVDAIIATGSNNTARYFEYYFGKYPHIIRRNRVSAAVLEGNETSQELADLAKDALLYFGMGCRSIAKLLVPEGYDLKAFLHQTEQLADLVDSHKYRNNYDYHKSIFLVNRRPHLDSGVLLLTEDEAFASPVSVVYYQTYRNLDQVAELLKVHADQLQCVAARNQHLFSRTVSFGQAQRPTVADYADGKDTMEFLLQL
ncbi:MAG: acyl-CoA reductase [Cytophagales bacterium]|nr:acyl-CoA reductase [Bernardetiaceae bacterium]MDW8211336.1 acyl-CoA reductase [Cytophagales bacterium]